MWIYTCPYDNRTITTLELSIKQLHELAVSGSGIELICYLLIGNLTAKGKHILLEKQRSKLLWMVWLYATHATILYSEFLI